ncbi:hypothetical protein VAE151_560996 [Vibrio aestuarianus]|nr:hypothetical protein VAE032_280003 [Vibrio aestuarianus]CAH8213450.1 hypothetical protein VAE128_461640 [Vibrio aestuarianus]CAH8225224.1 hypothetical protein VAE151_560996 [Vibrio aestuarianus]
MLGWFLGFVCGGVILGLKQQGEYPPYCQTLTRQVKLIFIP